MVWITRLTTRLFLSIIVLLLMYYKLYKLGNLKRDDDIPFDHH